MFRTIKLIINGENKDKTKKLSFQTGTGEFEVEEDFFFHLI